MTRAPTIAVAALLLAAPASARAEEPQAKPAEASAPAAAGTVSEAVAAAKTEEAKKLFASGTQHYAAGQFEMAAGEFATAYELTHAPELLYNLGRCYEHLGDAEHAIAEYALYLRMSPDAEDRSEVEARIASLEDDVAAKNAAAEPQDPAPEAKDGAEGDDTGSGRTIRLFVESGFDASLHSEWSDSRRFSIPVDAALLFGMNDWLHLGFGLGIAGFTGDEPSTVLDYPTGEFALHGDLAAFKKIKGRFSFVARISIAPTWIFRRHSDSAFWLLGRGAAGLHIDIWKSFGVLVEATGGVGAVFCRDIGAGVGADFQKKTSLAVDVGGRAGITYVF